MSFDEAFDILVEKCAEASQRLSHADSDFKAQTMRSRSYGCDIWIAHIVRDELGAGASALEIRDYTPFYDAAWELCRLGVLRPGSYAPIGQKISGGGELHTEGYTITGIGDEWLHNAAACIRRFGTNGELIWRPKRQKRKSLKVVMQSPDKIYGFKAELGNFLKAYKREYDTFQTLSLDVLIPGTKTTYLDVLAAE
jgi:hypothetical protein